MSLWGCYRNLVPAPQRKWCLGCPWDARLQTKNQGQVVGGIESRKDATGESKCAAEASPCPTKPACSGAERLAEGRLTGSEARAWGRARRAGSAGAARGWLAGRDMWRN